MPFFLRHDLPVVFLGADLGHVGSDAVHRVPASPVQAVGDHAVLGANQFVEHLFEQADSRVSGGRSMGLIAGLILTHHLEGGDQPTLYCKTSKWVRPQALAIMAPAVIDTIVAFQNRSRS